MTLFNKDQYLSRLRGFTLVEVSIVIIILGLMISAASYMYDTWLFKYRIHVTEERIEVIEQALDDFIDAEGRLPCVASFDITDDDSNFGAEVACNVAPVSGTFGAPGRAGLDVRIGAVPVRALQDMYADTDGNFLKIGKEHAFDGWGRRFTYAVTGIMAIDPAGYSQNEGAVNLIDTNDLPLTEPPQTSLYAIVSHGMDGRGGYSNAANTLFVNCSAVGATDHENCNNDATFRKSLFYSSQENTNDTFDDLVAFSIKKPNKIPAVGSVETNVMDCLGVYGQWPNALGQNCSSLKFTDDCLTPSNDGIRLCGSDEPSDSKKIFEKTFIAKSDGQAIIRVTIPVRYSNYVRPALLASIYLNGTEIHRGEIMNPTRTHRASGGGTGVMIGRADIVKGQPYNLEIFAFTIEGGSDSTMKAWLGTIRLADHAVDGVVEIIESEAQ